MTQNPGHGTNVTAATHDANLGQAHHCTNVTTLVNVTDVPTSTLSPIIIACPNVVCGTANTRLVDRIRKS